MPSIGHLYYYDDSISLQCWGASDSESVARARESDDVIEIGVVWSQKATSLATA